jgi:glycosyl transferase, family 25
MGLSDILIVVINLDRSPERLASIGGQLDRLGLNWQRMSACDGRTLSMTDASLIDVASFKRKHGKDPLPGELGCYLSHVKAIGALLPSTQQAVLVLEDDVQLGPDLPRVLTDLMEKQNQWDVVKLSGLHHGTPLPLSSLVAPYRLAVGLSRYTGASCYLVNRAAAQAYARDLLPMTLPYDHEYDQAWARGIRIRMVVPAPCVHSFEMGSVLHPAGVSRPNFHWTQRWGTLIWRARNECRRFVHGMGQWLNDRKNS